MLAPIGWLQLAIRLCLALLAGTAIGLEREILGKPAGLRTNMLVSLGAALFVLVPIELGLAQESPDALSRVIQGAIAGVGFIGGGTILSGHKVKGLTSAAAIWVSAGLGIAMGCGLWQLGSIGAALAWIVLRVVEWLEVGLLRPPKGRGKIERSHPPS
ncbi:MgtC/SapB family protein [Synechococcus sp. PCC 7336]|uniref:MgtC/SapB family protein n=1 Tax=Synechococcus sp. PCC 7336 TaxID=195250 RepID=UPI000348C960|nr:MgtC/SapB family protein [Synechococcus sp. PCC 7336]